ncbi:MAG: universal stress protein [Solirubrobacterales bacterium]|nr:universal stress protein [Solirubrobacterales bacterium]
MSAVDAPAAPEGEVARLTVDLEATRLAVDVDADLLAVPDSSPARALAQVAEQRSADLLVLGSPHHGPFGRALLGDVGRSVIHDAPCAVAPKRFRGSAPRRSAVGYDGSPEAQAALDVAGELASDLGAALTVYTVTVWQEPRTSPSSSRICVTRPRRGSTARSPTSRRAPQGRLLHGHPRTSS